MSIFMQVPLVVVKRLHRTAERSVLSLRSQMDKQHTGESDSELDDEVRVTYDSTHRVQLEVGTPFPLQYLNLPCSRSDRDLFLVPGFN